ncbi:MAG: hypothetical protein Q7R83_01775 [bacterium]|nr:hypothetical protein [bacterium]
MSHEMPARKQLPHEIFINTPGFDQKFRLYVRPLIIHKDGTGHLIADRFQKETTQTKEEVIEYLNDAVSQVKANIERERIEKLKAIKKAEDAMSQFEERVKEALEALEKLHAIER